MPRYFIEVFYKGTHYSGFQIQRNANSIQAEVESALKIFFRHDFDLTGSSRTDAGVHAMQNFFHVDMDAPFDYTKDFYYNLNALLPQDIGIRKISRVKDDAHCRFDAVSRKYRYFIYRDKDPFIRETAFYFPYQIDIEKLNAAAAVMMEYQDFSAFSKRNTQVNNFLCSIKESRWYVENNTIVYQVVANRFLRGMVKGLVGTMLRVGRGGISLGDFRALIEKGDRSKADFSPPSRGLFLTAVDFPVALFL